MHVMHSFDPSWVYTLNKDLEAIAHGFSRGGVSCKKWGTMRFYRSSPKPSNVNNP
jgi:hypothetical protein